MPTGSKIVSIFGRRNEGETTSVEKGFLLFIPPNTAYALPRFVGAGTPPISGGILLEVLQTIWTSRIISGPVHESSISHDEWWLRSSESVSLSGQLMYAAFGKINRNAGRRDSIAGFQAHGHTNCFRIPGRILHNVRNPMPMELVCCSGFSPGTSLILANLWSQHFVRTSQRTIRPSRGATVEEAVSCA